MGADDLDALILAPAALAVVLSWAAIGKLRASPASRLEELREVGGPAWLQSAWVAAVHPWLELVLALLLVVTPPSLVVPPTAAVLLLLAVYLILVASAYRRPEPARCACFGGSPSEVSRRTIARNAVLLGVAAVALADSVAGGGFAARLAEQGWGAITWLLATALLSGLAVLLTTTVGDGSPAPDAFVDMNEEPVRLPVEPHLELVDEQGSARPVAALAARAPQLLVFGSSGCAACSSLHRDLPHFASLLRGIEVRYVVTAAARDVVESSSGVPTWRDPDARVARALQANEARPASVLVGVDGLTAGSAYGANHVRAHVGSLLVQLNVPAP
ncbi:MAG TPA: MauE/DoxX family redox-associated membrane protein [Nocardioides sp.]|nr:MauE/DoxX family redox-associated membrane protein [Nocardioides sp.]